MIIKIVIEICLMKAVEPDGKAALVKDQCVWNVRKYSFSHKTIHEWNKSSSDCIKATG